MHDLYRLMRPACSECGAGRLKWCQPDALAAQLRTSLDRRRAQEALTFVGPNGAAWLCPRCSAWGVFE